MNNSRENIRRLDILFNISNKIFKRDFKTALHRISLLKEEYLSFGNEHAAEKCDALIAKYNSRLEKITDLEKADYHPIPTIKLLAHDFFREADLERYCFNIDKAMENYASAWAFFRQIEYTHGTKACDMELMSCGASPEELDTWHHIGMQAVESAKKYMPGMVNKDLKLPAIFS